MVTEKHISSATHTFIHQFRRRFLAREEKKSKQDVCILQKIEVSKLLSEVCVGDDEELEWVCEWVRESDQKREA